MTEVLQPRWMSPGALMSLLENPGASGLGAMTVYVKPGDGSWDTDGLAPKLIEHLDPGTVPRVARLVAESETGAVLFWDGTSCRLVLPPFPVSEEAQYSRWNTEPLQWILESEHLIGVLLVRLGRYAVGVYLGRTLLASKTDSRLVHGRHRAGGSSQARFARRREKQAQELYDEACRVLEERFTPFQEALEHVFLGGEKTTLEAFRRRCPYLARLSDRVRKRILVVREPGQRALERLPGELWRSRVYTLSPCSGEG